jgi:LmbE family N-acetylglucosaminyl deacetylase
MLNLQLGRSAGSVHRILCLGAHSDDIEIGCGGTLLTLLQRREQAEVRWVVFSATEERAREARTSAAVFLARARQADVTVRSYRDGFFPYLGAEIKSEFESIKRDFNPDLILTHYRADRHQDHRTISDLTWNTFRNHLILEYEIPKYDGDLGVPNFFVPLEATTCAAKIRHIVESFRSQQQKQWFDEQTFMAILRLRGMEANSSTRLAEAFYCRKAVLGAPLGSPLV